MFGKLLCSAAVALCLGMPAMAESTTQPVKFAAGATGTAVSGQISGRDYADFTLTADAGQKMNVRMTADNPSAYFNIHAPGDVPGESQALFIGSTSGMTADLTLPESGTYLIRTYLMPSAGRENQTARFSLTIDVAGRQAQSSDVTNALNSEPDYWKVTGITGTLNIRTEASTDAAVAGTVPLDATLRSLGCQAAGGRNWCKVETTSGTPITGWAASEFLAAGTAPEGTAPPAAQPAPVTQAPAAASTAAASTAQPAPAPAAPAAPVQQSAVNSAVAVAAGTASAPAPATSAAPAPAPAAPAGTVAPTDKPAVVATRPPVAPPSKIPLGGVAAQPATAPAQVSSAKPAPKPAQAAAAAVENANSSGTLPCSTALGMPTSACNYTVARSRTGNAVVNVTRPNGGAREITFQNGAPTPVNGLATERRGDLTVINIENERYEIPDAVINGG